MIVLASQELAKFWSESETGGFKNRFGSCDCSASKAAVCLLQVKKATFSNLTRMWSFLEAYIGSIKGRTDIVQLNIQEFLRVLLCKCRTAHSCQNNFQSFLTADSSISWFLYSYIGLKTKRQIFPTRLYNSLGIHDMRGLFPKLFLINNGSTCFLLKN